MVLKFCNMFGMVGDCLEGSRKCLLGGTKVVVGLLNGR